MPTKRMDRPFTERQRFIETANIIIFDVHDFPEFPHHRWLHEARNDRRPKINQNIFLGNARAADNSCLDPRSIEGDLRLRRYGNEQH